MKDPMRKEILETTLVVCGAVLLAVPANELLALCGIENNPSFWRPFLISIAVLYVSRIVIVVRRHRGRIPYTREKKHRNRKGRGD
ncbi:hypothetical protein [Gordonibacter massiliensis (ex Traore et al. 2017)]|uniref:hypothetical protein n=1 Tax=Gordonibacter massiliensis (ex Traore et al. 2017) TaxID=1841863 RepID=UPI001C8C4309|nr:hypothetical protein [Gordonibacter massiliensis (ex Traore et al. 2017)]MBX9035121.1 hypothetical protein [Gordonibacter massiliensis (ex Traore et al. 2017)]